MMPKICLFLLLIVKSAVIGQISYFPPLTGDDWTTMSPINLGWCLDRELELDQFLAEKGTKSFIILVDGKIVKESYYNDASMTTNWYWASAGKSLTSFLVGMAQEKGLLSLDDRTSDYLGQAWTAATPEQESQIKIRHQLTMTTGLIWDTDADCLDPDCLLYYTIPGTRWDYYNATYRLLQDVVAAAYGDSFQNFTNFELANKIGMKGLWNDYTYYSNARSMARFGLLVANNGVWNGTTLLGDQSYLFDMVHSSQNINPAYGYLWWLNGQDKFMLPTSQIVFNGSLIPEAPSDMYCALGKNDQKIYIIPSRKMVIVRMGEDGGEITGALSSFDNLLWEKLNDYMCMSSVTHETSKPTATLYPNPGQNEINIPNLIGEPFFAILNESKIIVKKGKINNGKIDISTLESGHYMVCVRIDGKINAWPFIKI